MEVLSSQKKEAPQQEENPSGPAAVSHPRGEARTGTSVAVLGTPFQRSSHPVIRVLANSGVLAGCPSRRLTHPTKPLNLMNPGEGSMAVPPVLVMDLPQGAECVPLSRQKSVLVENHNSCMELPGLASERPRGSSRGSPPDRRCYGPFLVVRLDGMDLSGGVWRSFPRGSKLAVHRLP